MTAQTLPAQLNRADWIEVETTGGGYYAGLVAYDRNGTVKIYSERNGIRRWFTRTAVTAVLSHIPNPVPAR